MKYITFTIPSYNSQEYMRHVIDNLVAVGDDIEVIIVNDGSTDDTGKIADEYQNKYPTIVKAIQKENGGHGSGVMAGLHSATGLYYKVVDSDDWVETNDVITMIDLIKKHLEEKVDIDLYITNYIYEHASDNSTFSMNYRKYLPIDKVFTWNDIKRIGLETVFLMHSLMYKTEKLRESGMNLPNHTFYVDDIYAYVPLPFMQNLYYRDLDFYHYFIGRADQSINYGTMCKRYEQQVRVFKIMFESYSLETLKTYPKHLYQYMWQFLMIIGAVTFMTVVGTKEDKPIRKQAFKDFKRELISIDKKSFNKLRYRSLLVFAFILPGYNLKSFASRKIYGVYQKKLKLG